MLHENDREPAILERISQLEQRVEFSEQEIKTLKEENQFLKQENQKKDKEIQQLRNFVTLLIQDKNRMEEILIADFTLQGRFQNNSSYFGRYTKEEAINILNRYGIFMKGKVSRAPKKESLMEFLKEKAKQVVRSIRKPILSTKEINKLMCMNWCPLTTRRYMIKLANAMPDQIELHRSEGKKSSWYWKILNPSAVVW